MPNTAPRLPRYGVAALLAATSLAGCASPSLHMASGTPAVLAPGQQTVLPDRSTLTYLKVAADSRCPPKVQCIRAGDADVVFEHRPGGDGTRRFTLNLPEAPAGPVGAFTLRILALEFGERPKATVRIDPAQP